MEKRIVMGTLGFALRLAISALLGAALLGAIAVKLFVDGQPELEPWHTNVLDEEFHAGSPVSTFSEYLALEERLFAELDRELYGPTEGGAEHSVNRYRRGSLADPRRWPVDWNRTYEIETEDPVAGVLLLHGLTDGPYSLRSLGETLAGAGARVLALRIPGHGTAPSALTETGWRDMAAAVRIAARHLREQVGDRPLHVIGYSNGGALAVEYAMATLEDASLPRVTRVVLISPLIGVRKVAALAAWQARLARLTGIDKLAWQSLHPEYNPFKYNSFAINAAVLAYEITEHLRHEFERLKGSGLANELPPILAFQSGADDTVTASALVSNVFACFDDGDDHLVLFDLNRLADVDSLLASDPAEVFDPLLRNMKRGFDLTVVTNAEPDSAEVVTFTARHETDTVTSKPVAERWPDDVFSLSHVALPFRPDDPLYGGPDAKPTPGGLGLGNLAVRGERGILRISAAAMLRISWNPFYDLIEQRTLEFLGLAP